ncbi:MAG: 5-formyltetrahydrofolate cyclo-ligase, partial [Candidatus Omnitrophica bacterium]|nr:5-formyltetrahydrofolate cyclo-ligase [Candidatus Omnitrophota bacterium]
QDMESGPYGILQPKASEDRKLDLDQIDMVIVPGVAFDRNNCRLGRGQGYYDRFLPRLSARTTTVGLAFDFQMLDVIPQIEPHDVPVSCVLNN